jgi:hypothetical protein
LDAVDATVDCKRGYLWTSNTIRHQCSEVNKIRHQFLTTKHFHEQWNPQWTNATETHSESQDRGSRGAEMRSFLFLNLASLRSFKAFYICVESWSRLSKYGMRSSVHLVWVDCRWTVED